MAWECAVSAADQILLWHGQSAPALLEEPLRTRAVVLLAACITDQAVGPTGPDVLAVPLAALVKCLDRYSASALEAADAPAGTGGEERQELLAAYGTDMFDGVRLAVREALTHHLVDSGPGARIEDRRRAFTDVERRRQARLLAELFPAED